MTGEVCPICRSMDGREPTIVPIPGFDRSRVSCSACGEFIISRTAMVDGHRSSDEQARALSHDLRWKTELGSEPPLLMTNNIEIALKSASLPSIPEQVDNVLAYLALKLRHAGRAYKSIDPAFTSAAGAIDMVAARSLAKEMVRGGYLSGTDASTLGGPDVIQISPTLHGWVRAGELAKGRTSEPFAFMAMKYGDEELETCVANIFRPAVEETGNRLEILRDRPTAGLIDNYLRSRLRLARFVIADLTHANNGAYWEAGFAEGLGKPVIYTCEKSVFDHQKTHFDTNHSQTIVWDASVPDETKSQLVACIQNTFPTPG